MRQLLEHIRHSQFYKDHLKQLPVTQALLKMRDRIKNLADLLQEKADPSRKRENLLVLLQDRILPLDEDVVSDFADVAVDVIVPIYNGYEYLVRLLQDIDATRMEANYILIDDKSTDVRIPSLLQDFAESHERVILMTNETNLGFVGTVNRGLKVSTHHVALVNTDTELPHGWLERLMMPILRDETVASTTPFTNSGTIFSFPKFVQNNAIYEDMSVEEMDEVFSHVETDYQQVPTGMGFCMGMNRKAIDEVGLLDQEAFGRGYGEENDWCLRAKAAGYHDVHVENLFVYHKHGGSFVSEEKSRLIAEHMEILYKRYPMYEYDVKKYVGKDPQGQLRRVIQLLLDCRCRQTKLYIINDWGGGSERYFQMQQGKFIHQGGGIWSLCYCKQKEYYELTYQSEKISQYYHIKEFSDLCRLSRWISIDEIVVNQLTLYPDLQNLLKDIIEAKKIYQAKLIMLFHDYYAICPSYNLTGKDGMFCGDATGKECADCYQKWRFAETYQCADITDWRSCWQSLLENCDEIRCFSEDTLKRVQRIYGDSLAYTLVPHCVDYLSPVCKRTKTTDYVNIAVLGGLSAHKGGEVVQQVLHLVERKELPVRIILIGFADGIRLRQSKHCVITGRYEVFELPLLVYQHDVDVVFIPSIWPETFSYTAEEAMQMNLPLVSFALGAPAERIKHYKKGMTLPLDASPEELLSAIVKWGEEHSKMQKKVYKQVLYLSEYKSFSSRYRLLHMAEELLLQGVPAVICEEQYPRNIQWDDVSALCIYRCRYRGEVKRIVDEAREYRIPVIYDIDDAIFDYENMDYIPEIDTSVYGDFKVYSSELLQCMKQADKITVSTDHMTEAVKRCLPDKTVFVNRNVASMQMQGISHQVFAERNERSNTERIVLGYFSGSNTHNGDFALITSVILKIMKKYPFVSLKIGGCLELSDEYGMMSDRIMCSDMVAWQRLPVEIAEVDINLMPLEDTFFHLCKSENKWMEAAFVGVPTIASFNDEIARATHDGCDIVLCRDTREWEDALERMIEDAGYRKRIAENAHDNVVKYKTTSYAGEKLIDFIFDE